MIEKIFVNKTKSGKGLKLRVGDKWFITNIDSMLSLLKGEKQACVFSTIEQNKNG